MPQFMHFRDSADTLPFIVRQNVDQSSSIALIKLLLIRRNNLCVFLFCFIVTALLYVQLYKFPNQLQLVDKTMDVLQKREPPQQQIANSGKKGIEQEKKKMASLVLKTIGKKL
ncbi:alpha-1,2-Mannosidase [Meloidogyne graminicola]|uniref:Alpha-1,2-Mannosidase n=1 Tax=Meloidogyne graminicola TaxID=189291 RepID=A0A8S9ZMV9_9BILA|nr:alpha-1,2-Mannosidase [Meloidogyne graminicola]